MRPLKLSFWDRRRREVVFFSGSGHVLLALPFEAKVSELKSYLLQQTGGVDAEVAEGASEDLSAASCRVTCDGKVLQDDESLEASGISPCAEIQLQVRHQRARAELLLT